MSYQNLLNLYKTESKDALDSLNLEDIELLIEHILMRWASGKSIFLLGNGGNAAFCANWATDLNIHPFVSEDKNKPIEARRIKVFNLSNDPTTITAILNDLGGENIFLEQLKYLSSPRDLVIGLSGSGGSANILKAFEYARANDIQTVLITRNNNPKINSDLKIHIPVHSEFPGQTGGNSGNFYYEDMLSKISHMSTGILCKYVKEHLND